MTNKKQKKQQHMLMFFVNFQKSGVVYLNIAIDLMYNKNKVGSEKECAKKWIAGS
ncbi:hypothetical protein D920_01802 [Enterococcus faecalis 13-SD-W-01]|jgi:hypothetical protein|nr:hypothetical protein D920_01802 [Enterococcus faecalis 13-SD-W-01]